MKRLTTATCAPLFDQENSQGQMIRAGSFHYIQALRSATAHELFKTGFQIAYFCVLEPHLHGIAHRQSRLADIAILL